MLKRTWWWVAGLVVLGAACEDDGRRRGSGDDDDDDGSGAAGTGTGTGTGTGSGTGSGTETGTSTGSGSGMGGGPECAVDGDPTPGDCVAACEILFCCASGMGRCAEITAEDEAVFRPGCETTCADQMALVAIVRGDDCDTTVETLKTASSSFAAACDGAGP
jgi:hypothetical protein